MSCLPSLSILGLRLLRRGIHLGSFRKARVSEHEAEAKINKQQARLQQPLRVQQKWKARGLAGRPSMYEKS